jgi:hypothetical protein
MPTATRSAIALAYGLKANLKSHIQRAYNLDVARRDIQTIIKFGEKCEFAALSKFLKAVDVMKL